MAALDYFTTHLKYEKNPSAKKAITAKVCVTGGGRDERVGSMAPGMIVHDLTLLLPPGAGVHYQGGVPEVHAGQ